MTYSPTFEGVVLMHYTNSQKISKRYLNAEAERIKRILEKLPFPAIYSTRFKEIGAIEDNFERLKGYMKLRDDMKVIEPEFEPLPV